MNKVSLNKNDNCLTYALKRIKLFDFYPLFYKDLVDGFLFDVLGFEKEILLKGDLLLSDKYITSEFMPTEILENGTILFNEIFQNFHVSVFEGNNLISDCIDINCYPIIRLRKIDDVRVEKILRFRKN